MKKRNFWFRTIPVVLALMLGCSCFIPGVAAENSNSLSLGSCEDDPIEAGLQVYNDDNQRSTYATQSTWQLFTMEAQRVTSLLTTRAAGKSFQKSDLEHGGLLIQGSFQYALSGTDYPVRCGACKYLSSTGEYYATHYVEANSVFELFDESEFDSGTTYYGFVTNLLVSEVNYVTGRLTFYDTNEI